MVDKVDTGDMTSVESATDTPAIDVLSNDPVTQRLAAAMKEFDLLTANRRRVEGVQATPIVIPLEPTGLLVVYLDIDAASISSSETSIVARFAEELHARAAGLTQLDANSVTAIAERAVAAIPFDRPATSIPNQLVGPFYDASGLSKWLGISRQAVHKRNGSTLLALHTRDRSVVYPSFQFMANGSVIPNLMSAIGELKPALPDPWAQAQWVNTKLGDLGERSVAETFSSERSEDTELALWWVRTEAARLAA